MNARPIVKSANGVICVLIIACLLPARESRPDEPDAVSTRARDLLPGTAPGNVRDDNGVKMKLVWCPPGIFTMEDSKVLMQAAARRAGEDNEDEDDPPGEDPPGPRVMKVMPVKVFIARGYWLGKYEVTQSEWKRVTGTTPWKGKRFTKEGATLPATYITWHAALDFCDKMTHEERRAGRLPERWEYTLPTEAQWERACRARTETRYSFGSDPSKLADYAWYFENATGRGEPSEHPVGQKKANPWGLYDMHGNSWEWCRDLLAWKLPGGRDPLVSMGDPHLVDGDVYRVLRGGGTGSNAANCACAARMGGSAQKEDLGAGFRVVLSPVREAVPSDPEPTDRGTIDK